MKNLFLILILSAVTAISANAQDIITKKSGEDISVKILDVGYRDVKYKKWDTPDGPTYTMYKGEILMIKYEDGSKDIFRAYFIPGATASAEVYPGMKYRQYRKLYNPQCYIPMEDDRYSPTTSGLFSWLVPGLGQALCGEVWRGLGFFGGSVASFTCIGIGTSLTQAALLYSHVYEGTGRDRGTEIAGMLVTMLGVLGLYTSCIWSIADACHVAKIKNMYNREVREMTTVSFKLEPYLATTATGFGVNPAITAGASLRINF